MTKLHFLWFKAQRLLALAAVVSVKLVLAYSPVALIRGNSLVHCPKASPQNIFLCTPCYPAPLRCSLPSAVDTSYSECG